MSELVATPGEDVDHSQGMFQKARAMTPRSLLIRINAKAPCSLFQKQMVLERYKGRAPSQCGDASGPKPTPSLSPISFAQSSEITQALQSSVARRQTGRIETHSAQ
jgi:hypothetical protein